MWLLTGLDKNVSNYSETLYCWLTMLTITLVIAESHMMPLKHAIKADYDCKVCHQGKKSAVSKVSSNKDSWGLSVCIIVYF